MEPIIILGQPRSGSSMTAGIFAAHGVWTGTCRAADASNAKGHFENIPIRNLLIETHKAIVHKGVLAQKVPGFREWVLNAIKKDGYSDGPWLWKGSAMYWPAFFEFTPQFVVVNRPRKQIFDSCRRSRMFGGKFNDDELYANIDFHQQQMDDLVTFKQAFRVNTFEIVQGNFSSVKKALEGCHIEFSDAITSEFVDTDLWHCRQSP